MSDIPNVLVLGGGIAGLSGACAVAESGLHVTLLEARRRLGGRILTEERDSAYPLELGAEFIHGNSPRLRRVVQEIPLPIREAASQHWRPRPDGSLEPFPSQEEVDKVTKKIRPNEPDESFAQFLDRHSFNAEARRAALDYVEGFHAVDPARFSVQALAAAEEAARRIDGEEIHRIVGGYCGLIQYYEERLRKAAGKIILGADVRTVSWHAGHVAVEAIIGEDSEIFQGNAAIVTLALGVLKMREIRFEPSLPDKDRAIAELEIGHVSKFIFRFRQCFWPAGFGFIHTFDDWLPTWWTNDDPLTLTAWAGGPKGERCADARPEFLMERAARILSRTFLKSPAMVRRQIEEVDTHNWRQDPFARMAYSYVAVDHQDAPRRLAEPVENTLFFAGEATSLDSQNGTVHGALDTGLRAAHEVNCSLSGVEADRSEAVVPH
jgi:monoamine oxidase